MLRNEVQRRFGTLLQACGYHETGYECDERDFGNEVLSLENESSEIQFISDRGTLLVRQRRGGAWEFIDDNALKDLLDPSNAGT